MDQPTDLTLLQLPFSILRERITSTLHSVIQKSLPCAFSEKKLLLKSLIFFKIPKINAPLQVMFT